MTLKHILLKIFFTLKYFFNTKTTDTTIPCSFTTCGKEGKVNIPFQRKPHGNNYPPIPMFPKVETYRNLEDSVLGNRTETSGNLEILQVTALREIKKSEQSRFLCTETWWKHHGSIW